MENQKPTSPRYMCDGCSMGKNGHPTYVRGGRTLCSPCYEASSTLQLIFFFLFCGLTLGAFLSNFLGLEDPIFRSAIIILFAYVLADR